MPQEYVISALIEFTLKFASIQGEVTNKEELDRLTSEFYKKIILEAERHDIPRDEAFNIVLGTLCGGAASLHRKTEDNERNT